MDFTPVLLVTLAIAWAAAAVYWVRTRVATPTLATPHFSAPRRRPGLALMSVGPDTPKARVLPLRGGSSEPSRPGHSLVQPARAAVTAPPARAAAPTRSPLTSEQARLRRRNVLLGLAAAAFLTLVAAFFVGGSMILLHLLIDAILLAYVLLLVQYQREIELERTRRLPVLGPPAHYVATGTHGRAG